MLLGSSLRLKGDAAGAKEILAPLVDQQPDWAEVRLELGLALGVLGENHAAIKVLTEAVNIDRTLSPAWSALGEQYVLIGDVLASDAAYSHHFNVSVNEPALQRAVTALRNGRPDVTEDILIEFLDSHPDHVNALKMLAEAAIACRTATRTPPRCSNAALNWRRISRRRATGSAPRSICRTACTRRSRISTSCSRKTRSIRSSAP